MAPAREGLDAEDTPGGGLDLRLVDDEDLRRADGFTQIVSEGDPGSYVGIHRFGEEPVGGAALGLRTVEREVGTRQQHLRIRGIQAVDGDANAGADSHPVLADEERLAEGLQHSCRQNAGIRRHPDLGREDGELVAAETGHSISFPDAAFQTLGDLLQQRIRPRDVPACR